MERGNDKLETRSNIEATDQIKISISPFEMLESAKKSLSSLLNELFTEQTKNFPAKILNLCKTIQQACEKDIDASLSIILLHRAYPYTIRHPVNIAIVCETITKHLKWKEDERLSLLAAALTANIAMIDLQEKLYSQKKRLSIEQREQINEHPRQGMKILRKCGVTNNMWLDAVHYHHEAIDGSGYPSGLRASAIPISSKIIAAVDHYCAGVSNCGYRTALSPIDAMAEVYLSSGKRVEPNIMNMCVKLIGIYPPGSFVRLANNEIAVVTHRGKTIQTPIVHSIIRANGTPFLTPTRRDCSQEEFGVKELITSDKNKMEINQYQLWGKN